MDWQQMFAALKAISPEATLQMRKPNDWYCRLPGVELKNGITLQTVRGTGGSPGEAVAAAWIAATELPSSPDGGPYLVVNATDPKRRRAMRWNGFMWADVDEEPVR